jgi:superoxide reductase
MKGFVCGKCGHIEFDSAPEFCPVCHAPKAMFTEQANAVNTALNLAVMSELEKKHVPVVNIVKQCSLAVPGCTDVSAKMGEIIHPMQPDHYILWVDFYINKKWMARSLMTPDLSPAAGIHLKSVSGKLSVIELCNKHGAWIKELDL